MTTDFEFVTQKQIERSDELLKELPRALQAAEKLQPEIEAAHERCEGMALKILACQKLESEERQKTFEARLVGLIALRDELVQKANGPLEQARKQIRDIIEPNLSHCKSWLSTVMDNNPKLDPKLTEYAATMKKRLDQQGLSLREILAIFDEARLKIEGWQVPATSVERSGYLGDVPRRMKLPRLQDFFRPALPKT
jgi:hypothetical protein